MAVVEVEAEALVAAAVGAAEGVRHDQHLVGPLHQVDPLPGPALPGPAPRARVRALVLAQAKGQVRDLDRVVASVQGGKKAQIYVDFGGRPSRARIVGADARNLLVGLHGGEMPLSWQSISPRRFASIAAKYAGADSGERMDLAALYAHAKRKEDAAEALRGITANDEATRTALAEIKKYIASGL